MTLIAAVVGMLGCGSDDEGGSASTTLAATGTTPVTGTAKFTTADGHVSVTVTITAAPAGDHGLHIHQEGACGNAGADAGGHWDGTATAGDGTTHGLHDGATHHLGDLGNITIDAAGTGTVTRTNGGWKLGDGSLADVVGHSIIFHMNPDDGTMASAGSRLGCGIIAAD